MAELATSARKSFGVFVAICSLATAIVAVLPATPATAAARPRPSLSVSLNGTCANVELRNASSLRRVVFTRDGVAVGTDSRPPYVLPSATAGCGLDTSKLSSGSHTIVAWLIGRSSIKRVSASFTVRGSSTTPAPPASNQPPAAQAPVSGSGFTHPGVLVDGARLSAVKAQAAAGREPWASALRRARSSRYGSLSYSPAPVPALLAPSGGDLAWIERNPSYGLRPAGQVEHLDDARAAYTQALLWAYTGDRAHAAKAIQIMNAWSSTLRKIEFQTPAPDGSGEKLWDQGKLQAGWGASLFSRAGEIIRYTDAGWAAPDIARFETMLRDVYLPHTISGWSNGANWLMTFAEATIGIGVFTNDRRTFDAGVDYWRKKVASTIYLPTDGAWPVAPDPYYNRADRIKALWFNPTAYLPGLQAEACRDLSHMMLGMGAMANGAETARIQGVDLWGEQRARLVAGFELAANFVNQYLDQGGAPASTWRPAGLPCETFKAGGEALTRGWDVAYDHYARRGGIPMPNTQRVAARTRGKDSAQLHLSWEALTHGG